jgi:hypothetical protein
VTFPVSTLYAAHVNSYRAAEDIPNVSEATRVRAKVSGILTFDAFPSYVRLGLCRSPLAAISFAIASGKLCGLDMEAE